MKRILVANRGEIALSAIRCIRELGLESVAVFPEVDSRALHVRNADLAVRLPGPQPARSYASTEALLAAARESGADTVYPGYGFLSESPEFAQACREAGLVFAGPSIETMALCRDKTEFLRRAVELGLPVPEHAGPIRDEADLVERARAIGYPLLLKPVSGTGGRQITKAYRADDLLEAWRAAGRQQEDRGRVTPMYLESYVRQAMHVEVTVLADAAGRVVPLGARSCVAQRRFQKLISEEPAGAVPTALLDRLAEAAARLARAVGLHGCGTVEFLVDSKGNFLVMELNPRIQVEYALTDIVNGVELIKEQLRLAAGRPLPEGFPPPRRDLYAIECRINAEDIRRDFRPSSGEIREYYLPGGYGYSVLSSIQTGHRVEIYYDPMILKLNCYAATREEALAKLDYALGAIRVKGVRTNLAFLRRLAASPDYRAQRLRLDFKIQDFISRRDRDRRREEVAAIVAALEQEVVGRFRTPAFRREPADVNNWNMAGRVDLMRRRTL